MEKKVLHTVRYDYNSFRKQAIAFLLLGLVIILIAVIMYFVKSKWEYIVFLVLPGVFLVGMSINYFVKLDGRSVLILTNQGIEIVKKKQNVEYLYEDILGVSANVAFSKFKKLYNDLAVEEIAEMPPLENISGDLRLILEDREVTLSAISDIFKLMEFIKDNTKSWSITIWVGQTHTKYRYWGECQSEKESRELRERLEKEEQKQLKKEEQKQLEKEGQKQIDEN